MITNLSPAARCLASSSTALGRMIGSMQSRMKSRCHSSSWAAGVAARISMEKAR
ncbi:hypothetical protein D3C78_1940120 [compost metagenome]